MIYLEVEDEVELKHGFELKFCSRSLVKFKFMFILHLRFAAPDPAKTK